MVALSSEENLELRSTLRSLFITQKDLAKTIGIHEISMHHWLQQPMTPEREARINEGINRILEMRKGGGNNGKNE